MTDRPGEAGDRPAWAQRMRNERAARGWSQADAVAALQVHAGGKAAGRDTLLRNWKRWEAGAAKPDNFYGPLIAKTFGTVTAAFFPADKPTGRCDELVAVTGMDALEILARLRASDVSAATLQALRVTADQLCCEYAYAPPAELRVEAQGWLRRILDLLEGRLSLQQHKEVLALAGTVALILGCVEYDLGQHEQAESTRRAAMLLTGEAGDAKQTGWAYEMQAWFALTQDDPKRAIEAAEAGQQQSAQSWAAVQLAAQQAKAWARLGDRRQVEVALDRGRTLLESLPAAGNPDNHFVVDPAKYDFYAMDCYRVVGENDLATMYANEVARTSADADGSVSKPMRLAEAEITLGVVAARSGELEQAVALGHQALDGERKSIPSLLSASRELAGTLATRYRREPAAVAYAERLHAVTASRGPS